MLMKEKLRRSVEENLMESPGRSTPKKVGQASTNERLARGGGTQMKSIKNPERMWTSWEVVILSQYSAYFQSQKGTWGPNA